MSQDPTARLFESAVPPIPPELTVAPYGRIRAQARRRRAATLGSAAGVAGLLVSVGLVAAPAHRLSTLVGAPPPATSVRTTPPHNTPPAVPGAPADAVTWQVVRVDRAGTNLTVYVKPVPDSCLNYPAPKGTVDETPDTVTITVTATAAKAPDCRVNVVTPLHVTLARPLGDRTVRDGRSGLAATVFQDRVLPIAPPPWTETVTLFAWDFNGWGTDYSRPGGPDLMITAFEDHVAVCTTATPSGPPVPVALGSTSGVLVDGPQPSVHWQVGNLTYTLGLISREGRTYSVDDLRGIINELI